MERGCPQCALSKTPTLGSINVNPLTETVRIGHVCNANEGVFLALIKEYIETQTNCEFPWRRLHIANFRVDMRKVNQDTPPKMTAEGYFKELTATTSQTTPLFHLYLFARRHCFKKTPGIKCKDGHLAFSQVQGARDVFWDGWYKEHKVHTLEIDTLHVTPPLASPSLGLEMQSIRTLIIREVRLIGGDLFSNEVHLALRDLLMLFAPQLRRLEIGVETFMFFRMIYSAFGIVGAGGAVWPRLCEVQIFWPTFKAEEFEAPFTPIWMMPYLEHLPNLHSMRINEDETHLQCIQVAPTLQLRTQLLPNTHRHTARVRFRTHMATHVFAYLRGHLILDLARTITCRYLECFVYPEEPPADFVYGANVYPISDVHFSHLQKMYAQCNGTGPAKHVLEQQRVAESAQEKLVVARQRAAEAKTAFDEKIVGKRKRLHNAVCKTRGEVARLESEIQHAQQTERRLTDMQRFSKEASKAYVERYVRQLLKMSGETRLVVDEKWMQ